MNSWKHLFLQLSVFYMLKVAFPLRILFNERIAGVRGKNDTELKCSFENEVLEEVNAIILLAKNLTSVKFIQIVRFRPDKPSILLPGGEYLSDRATFSNLTSLSKTATLTFQPLECSDEIAYQCRITYYTVRGEDALVEKSTKLIVTVNPSMPHLVWDAVSVMEGDSITLTCAGNIGKPPGTFIWQKRNGSTINDPYRNVTMESTTMHDTCTYHGTSNLTIEVTDEDDKAVIRCSLNNTYDAEYYKETKPLDVKYHVRKPTITKQPMEDEYPQGLGPIKLTCIGRGNPEPSYTWFRDGSMDEILNSSNTLYITEVITNNSGVYICNVSNNISRIEYTESTAVKITIVKEKTTTPTTTPTTAPTTAAKGDTPDANKEKSKNVIPVIFGVGGGVAFLLVIVIIGYCLYRRKRSHSNDKEVFRQNTVRNVDGYDSFYLDKGNGIRNKHAESQSHHNLAYSPNDTEKTAEENMNTENDTQGLDTRNEYASVNEATKLKNRTIDKKPVENQQKSNQDDTEDPYMESKDNTYAHLGETHQHKTDENTELYDKAVELTDRL